MTAAGTITVHCVLFGRYAEVTGRPAVQLELAADTTVADAVAHVRRTIPGGAQLPPSVLAAINREHVMHDRRLQDGDELALLPPLAGG